VCALDAIISRGYDDVSEVIFICCFISDGILLATQSGKLSQFVDNKWMEFRSKLLFSFYCRSDYQTIGYKEMSRFLCDLNATESRIATELMKFDIFSTNWTCTFTEFQELLQQEYESMKLNHLEISQLNQRHSNSTLAMKKRVTLDTRLITTTSNTHSAAASMLKTHVSQTVPICGKAPGLIIDEDLTPQYEWPQSILYTRNDNAHKIATFVLQQAIGLVHLQLSQEKMDQPSERLLLLFLLHSLSSSGDIWINKRDILCLLLGTSDKDRHLSYIQMLAEAACKIFTAQPTVVTVAQPCKVFGDIHGQFRDLLLLFSRSELSNSPLSHSSLPFPLSPLPPSASLVQVRLPQSSWR
jgi:hypothetical protein